MHLEKLFSLFASPYDESLLGLLICKSFWIKVSAKLINLNI